MSCNHREAIGGPVHRMMLEKPELIDGKHHQECLLEDGRKARHESWPVKFLFVMD